MSRKRSMTAASRSERGSARAVLRAGPHAPFDPGMIDAEPCAPQQHEATATRPANHERARARAPSRERDHERKGNCDIVRHALLEAERTGFSLSTSSKNHAPAMVVAPTSTNHERGNCCEMWIDRVMGCLCANYPRGCP